MKVIITRIPPYDGEYDIDYDRFTNRDLHDVKRISGQLPLEVGDALERGDTDVVVAFAVVALKKHGHQRVHEDALWDAELGSIKLDLSEEEEQAAGDAVPPPSANETATPSTPSGSPSSTVSELHPESHPSTTGIPSSERPASDHAISAT